MNSLDEFRDLLDEYDVATLQYDGSAVDRCGWSYIVSPKLFPGLVIYPKDGSLYTLVHLDREIEISDRSTLLEAINLAVKATRFVEWDNVATSEDVRNQIPQNAQDVIAWGQSPVCEGIACNLRTALLSPELFPGLSLVVKSDNRFTLTHMNTGFAVVSGTGLVDAINVAIRSASFLDWTSAQTNLDVMNSISKDDRAFLTRYQRLHCLAFGDDYSIV